MYLPVLFTAVGLPTTCETDAYCASFVQYSICDTTDADGNCVCPSTMKHDDPTDTSCSNKGKKRKRNTLFFYIPLTWTGTSCSTKRQTNFSFNIPLHHTINYSIVKNVYGNLNWFRPVWIGLIHGNRYKKYQMYHFFIIFLV